MDKLEHTFKVIGKFLSMASVSKVLIDFYGEDISKERMLIILKELVNISNDYLYPKNGFLEEINNNIEYKNKPIPQEIWDDNEVESIGATYLMPEGTITEYKKELDHLADYDDKYWNEHWDDEDGY